ncbi:MAG TPA: hypothetical protein VNH46_08470, partial [Gemmatimonadales bacterium]|nr:hypothetical protein [Gemmatimonadales bacterium]
RAQRAAGGQLMARSLAVALGVVAGAALGWQMAQRHVDRHREDLFSPRATRRMAALASLQATPGVDTVRLLRDYLEWEPHPALRRRARAIARRMEAALG